MDFFVDDICFERVYNNPRQYLSLLKKFKGVITPDFSLYKELQQGINIYNLTRNRNLAYYFQRNGINIIPTLSWCYLDDFSFCLDGIPKNSSVAISNNGVLKDIDSREIFLKGLKEIQKRLTPKHIILCGRKMKELDIYNNIIYYDNFSMRLKKRLDMKKATA